ncbi:MAG: F0F1 ATP synthase subunit gamma [Pseudonocardiales bacterium]|nr:F0F1 ATP synthase subunit gamma [Pseudonocardiales bacterium]MBV9729901.1 F0F1 ATP synthase subunit gamma [Pseudonocardiales bacterium]
MAAQLRVLRRRIRSVQSTKKITKAMELIATSRIARAQARVEASRPYAQEITKVLSALASAAGTLDHPLLVQRENPSRAAVLVVTSDRGLCGGYNANLLRAAEELHALLRDEGKSVTLYLIGRKAVSYYTFRGRPIEQSWTGFSEQPTYDDAARAGNTLVRAFLAGADEGAGPSPDPGPDGVPGVDELHIVYTEFRSMLTQTPQARRIAPLEVEYVEDNEPGDGRSQDQRPRSEGPAPLYEFEPDAEELLAHLLPKYINTRIYAALLEAAASEQAARRQAMQAATDNATDLIQDLTRQANQARQGMITQEISEIVGGAEALSAVGSESER